MESRTKKSLKMKELLISFIFRNTHPELIILTVKYKDSKKQTFLRNTHS